MSWEIVSKPVLEKIVPALKTLSRPQLIWLNLTCEALLTDVNIQSIQAEAHDLADHYASTDSSDSAPSLLSFDQILGSLGTFNQKDLYVLSIIVRTHSITTGQLRAISDHPLFSPKHLVITLSDVFPDEEIPEVTSPETNEILQLSWQAMNTAETIGRSQAFEIFDNALSIAEKYNIPPFDLKIGREWLYSHEVGKILPIYEEKLLFLEERNDVFAQIETLIKMSDLVTQFGNKKEGIKYIDRAEARLVRITDDEIIKIYPGWPSGLSGYLKSRVLIQKSILGQKRKQLLSD
jgi:hypothetical protein